MVSPVWGDVFLMKDGTKFEGVLLREDETSYVVEVQIGKSIKDERTFAKADVKSIEVAKADVEAFKQIASLGPVADGLQIHEYDQRIQRVERYLTEFPKSSKLDDAKAILTALRDERQIIKDGGLKSSGVVYTHQEYRMNAYNLDANLAALSLQRLVASGHYLQALRAFSEFEKTFGPTDARRNMVPVITGVIRRYLNEVAQSQLTYDQRVKERNEGLQRMNDRDRNRSVLAIQQQEGELVRQFEQQKDMKIGWVSPDPFCKPALDHTVSFARTELKRLETAKGSTKDLVDGGKIYRDVMTLAKRGSDPQAAKTAMSSAKQAGIPKKYLDQLQAEVDASTPPEK